MAARLVHKSLAFLLIISILFIRLDEAEARPLTAAKPPSFQTVAAVKTGGPSSGGRGHRLTDDQSVGEIMNSGPSPGANH
nr:PAMP-induced secreted peptide 2-like [Ipomoea batatas]